MLTLYSYPTLFCVADNNGYGLKVYAFLKLAGVPFTHKHIFDAAAAPRGQLPYIVDDGETIGDSDAIIAHVNAEYRLTLDASLSPAQCDTNLLVTRMLDDLYWVMSYSRWKDDRYYPAFRDAFKREHPHLTDEGLNKARDFNFQRYHFQGIGRYPPDRDLWLHCQYPLLRHRHAAQAVRRFASQSRASLRGSTHVSHDVVRSRWSACAVGYPLLA
ncbi:MAG: Tom37 metaxin N-terminal-like domain-containing protein [Terrimicrobiaceae bacterium]